MKIIDFESTDLIEQPNDIIVRLDGGSDSGADGERQWLLNVCSDDDIMHVLDVI